MFVLTAKMTRGKIAAAVVAAGILLIALVLFVSHDADGAQTVSSRIATNDQRVAYIESFGWKIDPAPVEFGEVVIPREFDDVYNNYNEVQKKQGFDLTKHAGRRVMQYTYRVSGYPEKENGEVLAHLLVYRSKVVGGDISSVRLDGFIHGFCCEAGTNLASSVTLPYITDKTTGSADSSEPANDALETGDTLDSLIPWIHK